MSVFAERIERLQEFFGDANGKRVIKFPDDASFDDSKLSSGLAAFNIEWHFIPGAADLPLDDAYMQRLYANAPRDFNDQREHGPAYREHITEGHQRHQGKIVGVETTQKPRYLPGNRQFYGSEYGHDPSKDPFARYQGRAGMMNGTRYDHNYPSLQEFVRVVNEDWRARALLPAGYRMTICPPGIFNLVGTVFHPEWSKTETLELGFYLDDHENATCYAVGSNGPGDFSYLNQIEGEGEWAMVGFRVALVPE
jgi:hypothetical protein